MPGSGGGGRKSRISGLGRGGFGQADDTVRRSRNVRLGGLVRKM